MAFEKLPNGAEELLRKLVAADNPSEFLRCLYKDENGKKKEELQGIVQELSQKGYIEVNWADNLPWHVTINNSARTYDERLEEDLLKQSTGTDRIFNDNSIHIGDGNTIQNATIASRIDNPVHTTAPKEKESFFKRHPILTEICIGVFVTAVMMFSFWKEIVNWIEGVF